MMATRGHLPLLALLLLLLVRVDPTSAGEYAHIDLSDEFDGVAKFILSLLFVATFVTLNVLGVQGNSRSSRWVAMMGAWLMLLIRSVFEHARHAPHFDVQRGVLLEPLVFLWASLLLTDLLTRCRGQTSNNFLASLICSALWIHNPTQKGTPWIDLASAVGSALCYTGSLAGMAILVKAYDEIPWWDYVHDMILPTLCFGIVGSIPIAFRTYFQPHKRGERSSYSALSLPSVDDKTDAHQEDDSDEAMMEDPHVFPEPQTINNEDISSGEADSSAVRKWMILRQALPMLGLAVLYFVGFNAIMVLISVAALVNMFLLCCTSNNNAPSETTSVAAGLDYESFVWYISLMILVSGWSDTGVPQAFFYRALGSCADRIGSGWCATNMSWLFGTISALVSPIAAVLLFGDSFPYASPADWMQLALAVSVGGTLCVLGGNGTCVWVKQPEHRIIALVVQAVACFVALLVGSPVMQYYHVSYECSVRLGECV